MAEMSKRERLEATVAGQPVDRIAVALWRHFPGDDQDPAELAASTLWFQQQYNWDFVKVSPSSSFCLQDWGVRDEWTGGDEGTRDYTVRAICEPEDWERLPVLDPQAGFLGQQLKCLELVREGLGDNVPFIQTIFSPLSQAKNLCGSANLSGYIRRNPAQIRRALEIITESTIRFVRACLPLGISGLYYATQFATTDLLTEAEYREFGEPYDLRILEAASSSWFNMLHLHGGNVMFDLLANYPVQAVNWHDRETPPTLAEGKERFRGAVCGGLARWDDMLRGNPARVREQVVDAIRQTDGRRLIVASGCVSPVTAPLGNVRAVRAAVEEHGRG